MSPVSHCFYDEKIEEDAAEKSEGDEEADAQASLQGGDEAGDRVQEEEDAEHSEGNIALNVADTGPIPPPSISKIGAVICHSPCPPPFLSDWIFTQIFLFLLKLTFFLLPLLFSTLFYADDIQNQWLFTFTQHVATALGDDVRARLLAPFGSATPQQQFSCYLSSTSC